MSALYNLEPQPTAKVILQTTSGDISLELFAKQTPLASRNFLQHCLDGYYNGTIFHRLVPGFIIQGGDPTGTGSGGISAIQDGAGFEDEFHSRLKFNRRGLLGLANEGKGSNGSQFFFTLAATPELQGKNSMFGRVEGETIYNLMKMAEAELVEGEGAERPLYPTRITGTEILVNPFEDMVARVKEAPRTRDEDGQTNRKRKKAPAGKNVLSFGGEEDEEGVSVPVVKKSKLNPTFVRTGMEDEKDLTVATTSKEKKTVEKAFRHKSSPPPPPAVASRAPSKTTPAQPSAVSSSSSSPEPEQRSNLIETQAEIAALKASLKRSNIASTAPPKESPLSALEAMIPTTSTRGRKRGKVTAKDEKGAFDLFQAFRQKLEDLPADENVASTDAKTNGISKPKNTTAETEEDDEEAALCDLHFIANCQSCASWADDSHVDPEAEIDDDDGWMAHSLSFAKDVLGKDLEWKRKMAEIEVIDPKEKAKAIKEERKDKGKKKAR